jgi:hypothetical protein
MQHAEMCMTAEQVVFNYAQGLSPAARIFGFRIFKPMREDGQLDLIFDTKSN